MHSYSLTFIFQANNDFDTQPLNNAITSSFIVKKLTYTSDINFWADEFNYLVGFKDDDIIDVTHIEKALGNLFKKNKFSTIKLSLENNNADIHFDLESFWTLKSVKMHGILIGKDCYRQFYLIENGDPFDKTKHQLSLEKILEVFRSQGYFNATVESELKRHESSKQITVHLNLHRGSQFKIHQVNLKVHTELSTIATHEMEQEIQKTWHKQLVGFSYTQEFVTHVTKHIKKYLERQGFIDTSISLQEKINHQEKKVDLLFTLQIFGGRKINFNGAITYSEQELLDLLLQFGCSAQSIPVFMMCAELERFYKAKGFWDVKIQAQENGDQCVFTVTEGERVSIQSIEFKDVDSFEHHFLAQQAFKQVLRSRYYDEQLLGQGVNCLIDWYHKEGFLDMKVIKQEFVPLDACHQKCIISIDEGNRFFLDGIKIEPYQDLLAQGPFVKYKNSMVKIPFNMQELSEQRRWLIDYFYGQGHASVCVKPEIVRKNGTIFLIWHVNASEKKIVFGKTIVVGTPKLPWQYILREMQYNQGDSWNKDAFKKSFLHLKKLDIFEHIHIYPDQSTSFDDQKSILVKVQEDEPFEIRVRAGLELQNFTQNYKLDGITYRVGGSFMIKSPFNQADQFKLNADFARVHREIVAQYKRPWLFDTPIKTIVEGYANSYCQPGFIGSTQNIYQIIQQGFLLGLSHDWGIIDAGFTLGFEWMKTNIPDKSDKMLSLIKSISRAINFNPRLLEQSVPYFQVEPTLIINNVDQQLNPTQGTFSLVSLKAMVPLNKAHLNSYFLKFLFEHCFYFPVKTSVVAARLRAGHIFFRSFSAIMPNERFYLGGANSLRGYQTDFAGPIGRFFDCNCVEQFAPQGGKSMINANAEWRFPIFKYVGGVVFQDLGALSGCGFADFRPEHILASTGCGVRVATPLGSLRFDVGWKWKRQEADRSNFAWFLTFGQAF